MAHWIIDDYGFGGTGYRCSECGESWCDIYTNVRLGGDQCPSCGAEMNEDETVYLKKGRPTVVDHIYLGKFISDKNVARLREYNEKEAKLIKVSGYDMDKLIELFAAGYTLRSPEYETLDFFDLGEEE